MSKICLVVLFVAVASAKSGIDITTLYSADTLSCFVRTGFPKASIEILSQTEIINQNFMNTWITAQDAGFSQVDAIAVANDHIDVDNITHALPGRFSGVLWLKVVDSSKLWSLDVSKRIAYLDTLVVAFKLRGMKVGVFSDVQTWSSVMGSQDAGSLVLNAFPVWYFGNSNDDFNDFSYAGFGTWKTASQKQQRGSVYVCNVLIQELSYYEK